MNVPYDPVNSCPGCEILLYCNCMSNKESVQQTENCCTLLTISKQVIYHRLLSDNLHQDYFSYIDILILCHNTEK